MDNARITSFDLASGSAEQVPLIEVTVNVEQVTVTYTELDDDGSPKGNTSFSWKSASDDHIKDDASVLTVSDEAFDAMGDLKESNTPTHPMASGFARSLMSRRASSASPSSAARIVETASVMLPAKEESMPLALEPPAAVAEKNSTVAAVPVVESGLVLTSDAESVTGTAADGGPAFVRETVANFGGGFTGTDEVGAESYVPQQPLGMTNAGVDNLSDALLGEVLDEETPSGGGA